MKVIIDRDEAWPVYSFSRDYGREIELSDEEVTHIRKVLEEYAIIQERLHQLWEEVVTE